MSGNIAFETQLKKEQIFSFSAWRGKSSAGHICQWPETLWQLITKRVEGSLTQIIELRVEKHFKRLRRNQWLIVAKPQPCWTEKGEKDHSSCDCIILNSTHYSGTQTSYVSLWFNLKLFRDPLRSTRSLQHTCVYAVILYNTTLLRLWWARQEN